MNIKYSDQHEFTKEQLQGLFLSVCWSSGHYPEKLIVAMNGFKTAKDASPMFITSLWT